MLKFVEPHHTGGDATIYITEDKAIAYQKKVIKKHTLKDVSDEEALEEFIIIHWAIVIDE